MSAPGLDIILVGVGGAAARFVAHSAAGHRGMRALVFDCDAATRDIAGDAEFVEIGAARLDGRSSGGDAVKARTAAQGAAFPRTLAVRLDPTATLELGSTRDARMLKLDGARKRNGCYGSAEAAAANPSLDVQVLPNLRGPGLLHVHPASDDGTLVVLPSPLPCDGDARCW